MSPSLDKEKYRRLFIDETGELIRQFATDVERLETAHVVDLPDVITELMRSAHSIKGSAATLGIDAIAELCHHIEERLLTVAAATGRPPSETVTLLVVATRDLGRMLNQVADGGEATLDADLVAAFGRHADADDAAPPPTAHGDPGTPPELSSDTESSGADGPDTDGPDTDGPDTDGPDTDGVPAVEPVPAETEVMGEGHPTRDTAAPSTQPDGRTDATASVGDAAPSTRHASVRVPVAELDRLMDHVSEMVIARGQLERHAERLGDYEIGEAVATIGRLLTEIQSVVAGSRMVPLSDTFARMSALLSRTARELGKEVTLSASGGDTELDRTVVNALSDPLTHILRNAVDHGIEEPQQRAAAGKPTSGRVILSASHDANMVTLTITDDGGGIDGDRLIQKARASGMIGEDETPSRADALRLIFRSGLSTKETSTTISGRGVGMDIVYTAIRRLGGNIDVRSVLGFGTTFEVHLPLSLAVIEALTVEIEGQMWALPLTQILETIVVESVAVHTVPDEVVMVRGQAVPLLHAACALTGSRREPPYPAVVYQHRGRLVALGVDELHRKTEVVVKPTPAHMGEIDHVVGTTILADGTVGLILDVHTVRDITPVS